MRPWLLVLAASVALAGCDMADYQKRMEQHRNRLKTFDEDNKVLGQLLVTPQVKYQEKDEEKTADAWPFDMFLRLPKGISSTHADMKEYGILDLNHTVFRYPGDLEGYNLIVSAAQVKPEKKDDEEVKKDEKKEEPPGILPDKFRQHVINAAAAFYQKTHELDAEMKGPNPANLTASKPRGDKGESLAFNVYTFEGRGTTKEKNAAFFLYIYQSGGEQAAFLFQIPADKNDTTEREKITRSLRTLAVGPAAGTRRSEFSRLNKK